MSYRQREERKNADAEDGGRQAPETRRPQLPPQPQAGDRPEHERDNHQVDAPRHDAISGKRLLKAAPVMKAVQKLAVSEFNALDEQMFVARTVRDAAGCDQILPVEDER